MNYQQGRKLVRVEGTCSDPRCPVAVADGAIWCEEHFADFRNRLARNIDAVWDNTQARLLEIEQWLERMQRRAKGESDAS